MLTLNVQVPKTREHAGRAVLREGFKTLATDPAAGTATPEIAAGRANPACDPLRMSGHPPFGTYRLVHHEETRGELTKEYGADLLLFEPESGQALEAESFGRLGLLVYAGARGADRRLRRTQGGLRLTDRMLQTIVGHLKGGDMKLELVPLTAPAWWQFWKTQAPTQPLSSTAVHAIAAPGDEISLLEALLPKAVRRGRASTSDTSSDMFDHRSRSDRSDTSASSSTERFEGKGGASGGAGASGTWDAGGRPSGVDSAGRIVGAAVAVGAVGAMVAMAASAGSKDGQEQASGSDANAGSGTDTSTAY